MGDSVVAVVIELVELEAVVVGLTRTGDGDLVCGPMIIIMVKTTHATRSIVIRRSFQRSDDVVVVVVVVVDDDRKGILGESASVVIVGWTNGVASDNNMVR